MTVWLRSITLTETQFPLAKGVNVSLELLRQGTGYLHLVKKKSHGKTVS